MLGFVQNMKIFCPEIFRGSILAIKLLRLGYSTRKLHATFMKCYGRHTDMVHECDTSVSHMLKVCSPTVPYDWLPVV